MATSQYHKPIPIEFDHEGVHYTAKLFPLGAAYLDGVHGWFTIESEHKKLSEMRAIIHHHIDGWLPLFQFADKKLALRVLEELIPWYG